MVLASGTSPEQSMKKWRTLFFATLLAASTSQGQETLFWDNFEDLAADTPGSTANLNTSRPATNLVGSWTVTSQRNTQVETTSTYGGTVDPAQGKVIEFIRGLTDYTANFVEDGTLLEGIRVSFDISGSEPQHWPCGQISVIDTNNNELLRITLPQTLGTAEPSSFLYSDIAYWDGTQHVLLYDNWFSKQSNLEFASVELVLNINNWAVSVEGVEITNSIPYLGTTSGRADSLHMKIAPTEGVLDRGAFALDNLRVVQSDTSGTVITIE